MNFTSPTITHKTPVTQKQQSRNAALKVKNGSPVLRELLRDKCRIRVKEHRFTFFNKMRQISEVDKKEQLDSIIREEISELEQDLQLQELIFQEIKQDAEQWLIDEFEREEDYLLQKIDDSIQEVFCPLCQKSVLKNQGEELSCPCGLRLSYTRPLTEFYTMLWGRINDHGNVCSNTLTFFSEPQPDQRFFALYATCPICDYLVKIVD